MITFSSSWVSTYPKEFNMLFISWQLMIFIVISRWVWSALVGGCGLPLIFVSESWSQWNMLLSFISVVHKVIPMQQC